MCSVNTIECALELRLCKAELVIARRSLHAILCDLLCMLGASNIDILSPFAGLHQDNGLFLDTLMIPPEVAARRNLPSIITRICPMPSAAQ